MPEQCTGIVLTFNGERHLAACLESLDFCDELLVVDSGSDDQSLEIARQAGATILHRDWEGTIPQFRFAFTHVKTPWIVTIDQDEILSAELRDNIIKALENPAGNAGFWCPRKSWYLDRFIMHCGWYPDRLLRLFRLDSVEIRGTLPHEEFHPTGKTGTLDGDIIHYPYENLAEHLDKINRYTSDAAKAYAAKGKKASVGKAFAHAVGKFLKTYLLKQGWRDGRAGFVIAVHSFVYAFHKYLKIMEQNSK